MQKLTKKDISIVQLAEQGGRISLSFGQKPRSIIGAEKLVQIYFIILLTSPGSKLLDKEMGSPLGEMFQNVPVSQIDVITDILNVANIETLDHIRTEQFNLEQQGRKLPDNEKLKEARVLFVRALGPKKIEMNIQLITEDDKTASAPLEIFLI